MKLLFKAFDSKMASREKLFKNAVEFANLVGRENLLTLSHSEDRDNIVITIWYWGEEHEMAAMARKAAATAAGVKLPPPGGGTGLSGGYAGLEKELAAAQKEKERLQAAAAAPTAAPVATPVAGTEPAKPAVPPANADKPAS